MRRPLKEKQKHIPTPDITYGSDRVGKLINYVMHDGKKSVARSVVHDAFDIIKKEAGVDNPVEVFEQALTNVSPALEVRSRRVGGANYQVPYPVRPERQTSLALRWIIDVARNKKGGPMANRLANEILAARNNEGEAVKKRENMHRMADANKAFAHFAWGRK